jgi:hypothetical protein
MRYDVLCPHCGKGVNAKLAHQLKDDMWKGSPAFIIGGGPSVSQQRDHFPLLHEYGKVVVTNRAIELDVRPDLWVWMEDRVFMWCLSGKIGPEAQRNALLFDGIHVARDLVSRTVDYPPYVTLLKYRTDNRLGESFSGNVNTHSNVGFFALNLAYLLGADPIVLIGFDQRGALDDQNEWYHEGYPRKRSKKASHVYTVMRSGFENAAIQLAHEGRTVWNASPGSTLDFFETIDSLEEVFGRLQLTPLG